MKEQEKIELLLEIRGDIRELRHKLYGIPPTNCGDIGEIKKACEAFNTVIGEELRPNIVRLQNTFKIIFGGLFLAATVIGGLAATGVLF